LVSGLSFVQGPDPGNKKFVQKIDLRVALAIRIITDSLPVIKKIKIVASFKNGITGIGKIAHFVLVELPGLPLEDCNWDLGYGLAKRKNRPFVAVSPATNFKDKHHQLVGLLFKLLL
jgi:hypothetical protein